jgi:hypothetical protein
MSRIDVAMTEAIMLHANTIPQTLQVSFPFVSVSARCSGVSMVF